MAHLVCLQHGHRSIVLGDGSVIHRRGGACAVRAVSMGEHVLDARTISEEGTASAMVASIKTEQADAAAKAKKKHAVRARVATTKGRTHKK